MRINTDKKKTGTYRKDRDRKAKKSPTVEMAVPATIEDMRALVLATLREFGISQPADAPLVDAYCREMMLYKSCMDDVAAEGVVMDFENGKQVMQQINPKYKAAKLALDSAMKLATQFGLTLKARVAMANHLFDVPEENDDPLSAVIKNIKAASGQ